MPNSKEWKEYEAARGQHDCEINELNNWFGSARCLESWECQGARNCETGVESFGWCVGDSSCPQLGPLDYHDMYGNIKWEGNVHPFDQENMKFDHNGLPL